MVFEKIRDIIAEQLDVNPEAITMETDLMKDLEVPDEKAEDFKVVANIVSFVEDSIK